MMVQNKHDTRFFASEVRLHDTEGMPKIDGYAAVFGKLSEPIGFGEFREIIRPGAFTKTLETRDVFALVDHDFTKVLGRMGAGTLQVVEDARGLRVQIDPPDTTFARDAIASVRRGDIEGMSFRFNAVDEAWETRADGTTVRELREVELIEVTVTAIPAYQDTAVSVRSLELLKEHKDVVPNDILLRKLQLVEVE